MLSRPIPQPKPVSKPHQRTQTHNKRMAAFRDAVWAKFGVYTWRGTKRDQMAPCEGCDRTVFRYSHPFGSADHVKMRSTSPEEKYNPLNGKILCEDLCHKRKHRIRVA